MMVYYYEKPDDGGSCGTYRPASKSVWEAWKALNGSYSGTAVVKGSLKYRLLQATSRG